MAIQAVNGARPLSLPPRFQVAAFTLTMKSIFQIRSPCLGQEAVAALALLHRLAPGPEVPFPPVFVVAPCAGQPGLPVAEMAKPDRRLFPGAGQGDLQPARFRGLVRAFALNPQHRHQPQEEPGQARPDASSDQ